MADAVASVARIVLVFALLIAASADVRAADPVPVIFDTDVTGDVDDVLALAMLHTLADRGQCDLLAVTISKGHALTGPFVDAANTFYGRPDLPIGVPRHAPPRESRYLKLVETKDDGAYRYPHDVTSNDQTPTALDVFRATLAKSADHSVVIVQVGLGFNLAELLDSAADTHSPLNGVELIRQKVKRLSVMAGSFEPINGETHFLEANVRNHVASMQKIARDWPGDVPVIWSGFEIGIAVAYPRESIASDFGYVPHHIVRESYLLHSGPDHDRPTWDLTSVLDAVFPDRGYFNLSVPGRVTVANDGFTAFEPTPGIGNGLAGRDRYLVMNPNQAIRVREALVQFTSQPAR